ncbi:conserved hypothetical protein [Hyella patelloides LEGE 07179]|uniref:Uncharacterized protein n=1 Tax=Hyella patelloides LEGE 07179 TaxID=945734 RepID=A0A563VVZ7_9CYAN|nr:hypothetical protein [Hyella patelloides]VEP15629.1 conserved hypothetical protein [Hyella patelloides LEGE 07179]
MKKTLLIHNFVAALVVVDLVTSIRIKSNATNINNQEKLTLKSSLIAQDIICPSLDEAYIPVNHPVYINLNQKFRAEDNSGRISNIVRVGTFGAASWSTKKDFNGRYTSAPPVAIEFKSDKQIKQAVIANSGLVEILKSWGASSNTAECLKFLLAESGI